MQLPSTTCEGTWWYGLRMDPRADPGAHGVHDPHDPMDHDMDMILGRIQDLGEPLIKII